MLLDLVSKARSGTSAEIEAMMAERDFFRERYAEQIETIEQLNVKLKESQRVIDKLRRQILDLELENKPSGMDVTTNPMMEGSGNGNNEESTSKFFVDGLEADCSRVDSKEVMRNVDVGLGTTNTLRSAPQAANENSIDQPANIGAVPLDDKRSAPVEDEACNEGGVEEAEKDGDEPSSDHEENEAEQIRANAERMLQWANYQSSKRSTPNTSMNYDCIDDGNNDSESYSFEATSSTLRSSTPSKSVFNVFDENTAVFTIPNKVIERENIIDDDDENDDESSTVSSSSGPLVGTGAKTRGGKIGKLFNSLRGMIEGSSSESESEVESDVLSAG